MTEKSIPAGLRLRITHCRGVAVDAVWSWPVGRQQVSVQEVLAVLAELSEPWLEEALKIVVVQEGENVWRLSQASDLLLCSCNGVPLKVGQTVLLQHHDALELGLCHLQVLTEPERPHGVNTATVTDFEWGQLVTRHGAGRAPSVPDAMPADSVMDLLTDALDAARPQLAPQITQVQPQVRAAVPLDATPQQTEWSEAEQAFQGLHAQYLQRLMDPLSPMGLPSWQAMTTHQSGQASDAFQDIIDQAEQGPTMPQLLGQSVQIQSVMSQLDTLAEGDILEPDAHVSVLHLFAPEGLRDALTHQVPSLNRQEHHGMALDSAMAATAPPSHASQNIE
ncbi:TagK domain-containing protein [Limnohabitans sp. Jir72]|uniref:TagK domain-containing protein n=1 Tax=Limnohabitans sp. Jir72 TaxID=1977909 RepID=UPI000D33FA55|nr:TagK domain-containing protein [Limnohabitans sp. Jir72]PUE24045.1 hypothetical protein B9Z52_17215 [Limnohabitans sp. Jir72]